MRIHTQDGYEIIVDDNLDPYGIQPIFLEIPSQAIGLTRKEAEAVIDEMIEILNLEKYKQ